LLKRGVKPPDTGSPRYNKLWWTIGPQFSSDVYGILAPGMPNVAAGMARELTHINGYAEGTDGAVFVSGMISLGFVESDTREIVRQAAQLISPLSPYRQCLDMVISMAEAGKKPQEIFQAINERWGIEYPATNNAVVNGGIVATSVWFGTEISRQPKILRSQRPTLQIPTAMRLTQLPSSRPCMGCQPCRRRKYPRSKTAFAATPWAHFN
jgi:hypothetical protein